MARNALGRGLGALIREPEVAPQVVPPSYIRGSGDGRRPSAKLLPAGRCRSISI